MLCLAFEVEDDTGIAVQKDIHSLERHLSILQLRRAQKQTPITSYFQPCGASEGVAEGVAEVVAEGSNSARGTSTGGPGAGSASTGCVSIGADTGESSGASTGVEDVVLVQRSCSK